MQDCRDLHFLTLVVASMITFIPNLSWTVTTNDLKPSVLKEPIYHINDPSLAESAFQNKQQDQILQLNIGILVGDITKKLNQNSHHVLGFTYDWKDLDQNFWSISAKWLNTKAAWLEAGKKFIIFPENLHEPYYKLSISHFMDPDDSLAGLTRIDSFKASLSFGFLDLWTMGRILNLEAGIHWGIPGLAFHTQAGFQWSF